MQSTRINIIGLALLALGLASGCSSDGSDAKGDAGGDNGASNANANEGSNANGGEDAGNNGSNANVGNNDPIEEDAGKDAGPKDSGICTPMFTGCADKFPDADPATLCGQIDDGCGVMIDCDPEDDNCEGFGAACNDPTKPNQCGCGAKTCADVVAGGAQCGQGIDDSCGGTITDCGTCTGAQDVCGTTFQCECVPNNAACAGKVCGSASDGCNGTVQCGTNGGACGAGTGACSADQSKCECALRATACSGQPDGPLNVNGCAYVCGACVADNAIACGTAECGTATNNCGEVVNCGANAGGCVSGKTCVDPTYVEAATKKACVDDDLANLIGTYAVRTHAFRRVVVGSTDTYQRAQALSLVKITLQGAGRTPRMIDYGCSASSVSFPPVPGTPAGISVSSNAASYDKIAPAETNLEVAGNDSGTGTWNRPVIETVVSPLLTTQGVPTGIILKMPSFCPASGGGKVTPTDGFARPWLTGGKCDCPVDDAAAATMPTSNAAVKSQDCRVVDADADGKPGFTVTGTAFVSSDIYNVSISGVRWTGSIRTDGYHSGVAIEPNPILRAVVGCDGNSLLCSSSDDPTSSDCACGNIDSGAYNFVQFAPLDGLAKAADTWTCADVRTNANGEPYNLFRQRFGSCTGATYDASFPTGTVCKNSQYYPASSSTSCTADNQCPTGTQCLSNQCWPLRNQCVATKPCTNPPAP